MKMISVALMGLLVVATAPFAAAQQIQAAGATFPAVIYQKWFEEYRKLHTFARSWVKQARNEKGAPTGSAFRMVRRCPRATPRETDQPE